MVGVVSSVVASKGFLIALGLVSIAVLAGIVPVTQALAAPANDDFANAEEIGQLPFEVAGSTVGATVEPGDEPPEGGHTVWFKWTAPASIPVRVDVCDYKVVNGPGNAGLWAYTGASIPTLVLIAESFSSCRISFAAVEGTTYRIKFDTFFGGEGDFTLRMFQETPPANDDFADAQVVGPGLPISAAGSDVFSTVEPGEPHHASNNETDFPPHDSVWYSWTAGTSAETRIRVCDNGFGARLGVYTGATVGNLTRVTTSVPLISFPYCSLRFAAKAGTTYGIAVSGGGEEREGSFTLDIHRFVPPPNDNFADAQVIGPELPIALRGSNIDASAEQQEPDHSPFEEGPAYESVWYSWTPGVSRMVRISTCGTGFASWLAVYTGSLLDSLHRVATGQAECGPMPGNQADLSASAGTRYLIAVAGAFPEQEGPFDLGIFDPLASPPPAGALPAPPVLARKPTFSLKRALRKCRKIRKKKARRRCIHRARRKAKRLA